MKIRNVQSGIRYLHGVTVPGGTSDVPGEVHLDASASARLLAKFELTPPAMERRLAASGLSIVLVMGDVSRDVPFAALACPSPETPAEVPAEALAEAPKGRKR